MSDKHCPSEAELLSFVDSDLSPERLARVEKHLEECSTCAKQERALRRLIDDIKAPPTPAHFDASHHVSDVMRRLNEPPQEPQRLRPWMGALAAAAAVLLVVALNLRGEPSAHFAARGGAFESSLARDVGVEIFTRDHTLRAIEVDDRVHPGSTLTAALRNLGRDNAYLLLFAVDSRKVVHWIAPEYTTEGTDPEASPIEPSDTPRFLPSAVLFDDLARGKLRVFAVITRRPTRVSEIEKLPPAELEKAPLTKRFPNAEVREFVLDVEP